MNPLLNLLSFSNSSETDVYHFAARKIVSNIKTLLFDTIYDTADECSSSVATISRLSQKLGYRNYTEMRHNIFEALLHYPFRNRLLRDESSLAPENIIPTMDQSLSGMKERVFGAISYADLERGADMIHEAASVHFYTYGYIFSELSFQQNLMKQFKPSVTIAGVPDQTADAKTLEENDLVIFVYPDAPMALDIIPLAAAVDERGAKSLLVTSSMTSSYRSHCTDSISFPGDGTNMDFWGMELIVSLLNTVYRKKYVDAAE